MDNYVPQIPKPVLGVENEKVRVYLLSNWMSSNFLSFDRAVQWHYIEKISNDTVPIHTLITLTNHQALYIYNRTKIAG